MIEDVDQLQRNHIQSCKALTDMFVQQYQQARKPLEEALRIIFNNRYVTPSELDKMPPFVDEGVLRKTIFRACLVATRPFYLDEGVGSDAKMSFLEGFSASLDLLDLLKRCPLSSKTFDQNNTLSYGDFSFKPQQTSELMEGFVFPQTFDECWSTLRLIRQQRTEYSMQRLGSEDDERKRSLEEKNVFLKIMTEFLFANDHVDEQALEQELVHTLGEHIREATVALSLVVGHQDFGPSHDQVVTISSSTVAEKRQSQNDTHPQTKIPSSPR